MSVAQRVRVVHPAQPTPRLLELLARDEQLLLQVPRAAHLHLDPLREQLALLLQVRDVREHRVHEVRRARRHALALEHLLAALRVLRRLGRPQRRPRAHRARPRRRRRAARRRRARRRVGSQRHRPRERRGNDRAAFRARPAPSPLRARAPKQSAPPPCHPCRIRRPCSSGRARPGPRRRAHRPRRAPGTMCDPTRSADLPAPPPSGRPRPRPPRPRPRWD